MQLRAPQLRNGVIGRERDFGLPAFYCDAAVLGVDSGDYMLSADGGSKFGCELWCSLCRGQQKSAETDD